MVVEQRHERKSSGRNQRKLSTLISGFSSEISRVHSSSIAEAVHYVGDYATTALHETVVSCCVELRNGAQKKEEAGLLEARPIPAGRDQSCIISSGGGPPPWLSLSFRLACTTSSTRRSTRAASMAVLSICTCHIVKQPMSAGESRSSP